ELDNLKNQTITAVVRRDNQEIEVPVKINEEGKMGMAFALGVKETDAERLGLYKVSHEHYSLASSIPIGLQKGKDQLVGYGKQLKILVIPDTGAYNGVGGFKAIY